MVLVLLKAENGLILLTVYSHHGYITAQKLATGLLTLKDILWLKLILIITLVILLKHILDIYSPRYILKLKGHEIVIQLATQHNTDLLRRHAHNIHKRERLLPRQLGEVQDGDVEGRGDGSGVGHGVVPEGQAEQVEDGDQIVWVRRKQVVVQDYVGYPA